MSDKQKKLLTRAEVLNECFQCSNGEDIYNYINYLESIIEELLLLVKHNKLPCSACKRLKKKFSGFQSELPLRKED